MSATAVFASGCTSERPPRAEATPAPRTANGLIAFASDRDQREGVFGVYVVEPDGSGLRRLIDGQASTPQWAPDGKSLAFIRSTDLAGDPAREAALYVVRSDGSGEKRVTQAPVNNFEFSWATDGKRIVFTGGTPAGTTRAPEVYVVNADGTNERKLTTAPEEDGQPEWSPDGKKISFWRFIPRGDAHASELWVMSADGTNAVRIDAATGASSIHRHWSPDGKKLALEFARRSPEYTGGEIFTVSPDGTDAEPVTRGQFERWSPDGRIIFRRHPGDAYSIKPDGTGEQKLGLRDLPCFCWSPDGKEIVVSKLTASPRGDRTAEQHDVFLMNPDGTGERNLTNHPAQDVQPSWQSLQA